MIPSYSCINWIIIEVPLTARIPIFIVPKREQTLVFFTEIISKELSGEFIIGFPPILQSILLLLIFKFVIIKSAMAVSPSLSWIILIIVLFPSSGIIYIWISQNFDTPGGSSMGLTLYVSWVDATVI